MKRHLIVSMTFLIMLGNIASAAEPQKVTLNLRGAV